MTFDANTWATGQVVTVEAQDDGSATAGTTRVNHTVTTDGLSSVAQTQVTECGRRDADVGGGGGSDVPGGATGERVVGGAGGRQRATALQAESVASRGRPGITGASSTNGDNTSVDVRGGAGGTRGADVRTADRDNGTVEHGRADWGDADGSDGGLDVHADGDGHGRSYSK